MISRRNVLVGLMAGALPATDALPAPATHKMHRVGHLSGGRENRLRLDAFRAGMQRLGYVEGRNLIIDVRYANGRAELLASLTADLIGLRPDALLVATTPANVAAKAATSTIPIVMVAIADPIGAGIVSSLSRPGANITGVTNMTAELAGKRLEILKEMVPNARRIAVLVNPDNRNASLQMRSAQEAALRLGIDLSPIVAVRKRADLATGFEAAVRGGVSGAIRMIDPLLFILRKETVALAAKHRLPIIYTHREDVEDGGLVAYGANLEGQFRQAARLVDKILKGANPADLPVEQPKELELLVNMKTAKALGITPPPSILLRADQVIE